MDKNKIITLVCITMLVVWLDQMTKAMILERMMLHESIPVIPGFFSITHVQNPGGAFGLFAGQSPMFRRLVFIFISFAAIGLILYFYFKTPKSHGFLAAGFALIFGGAIGNMIDRIRFGKVVDFLDVYIGTLHWPAFNVADSAISIGMGIMVFHLVFNKMPE